MVEAKTCQPGPIGRLRDRLVISASARHLAIDLVERHGDAAPEVALDRLAKGGLTPHERLVLVRAEPIVAALLGDGASKPLRACRAYRAMVPATRSD